MSFFLEARQSNGFLSLNITQFLSSIEGATWNRDFMQSFMGSSMKSLMYKVDKLDLCFLHLCCLMVLLSRKYIFVIDFRVCLRCFSFFSVVYASADITRKISLVRAACVGLT